MHTYTITHTLSHIIHAHSGTQKHTDATDLFHWTINYNISNKRI